MKVRRIDYFPDEFLVGTAFMSNELVGAYWRICSLIYSKGGAIEYDLDRLSHYLRERPTTVRKLVEHLVRLGKLVATSGFLTNSRAETELEKVKIRSEESSKYGKTGGRGHKKPTVRDKENNDLDKASALGAEKPTTTTNHQPPPSPKQGEIPPDPPSAENAAGKDPGPSDLLGEPAAATRKRPRAKLTLLPADWTVPPAWLAWAADEAKGRGLTGDVERQRFVEHEAQNFPDYWRSVGKPMADWEATWRRRVRDQLDRRGLNGTAHRNGAQPEPVDRTRARREGISRVLAREVEPGTAGG